MNLSKNIVLIGMPGCGKSTIGKELAGELKIRFCDIDEYIVKTTGLTIEEIFREGEDTFRVIEKKCVKEISEISPQVIATGGGVIKDSENIKELKSNGIIFFINRSIEKISTDVDILSRPLLKSGKEKLYDLYKERYPLYKIYCDYEIINNEQINKVKDKIITQLEQI